MVTAPEQDQAAVIAARSRDDRLYLLCQILGWGCYACFLVVLDASQGAVVSGAVLVSTVWSATGLAGTHLLRTYTKKRPWRTTAQLTARVIPAVLLIPAAMVAAQTLAGDLFWQLTGENDPRRWSLLLHFFQAGLLVTVWCALYVSVHEIRRRRAAEVEALHLALVAQTAQFRALRSQLNPHFLFNCLNSLRELIRENPAGAERAVTELAELLRYTLHADRAETVSLKDEIHAVQQYLSLEKVRFEERLRLRFEIEPAVLGVQVPPMLVQTLAENALKHGIAKLPEGGELAIGAHRNGRQVEIVITSPGSSASGAVKPGIGLENARERLRLVYGGAASLGLLDVPGPMVEARVTIPLTGESELE